MKKLIATFPDNVELNLSELMKKAIDFKIETVGTKPEVSYSEPKRKYVAGTNVPHTIMSHYTPSGTFTSMQADLWAKQAGFGPTSGAAACGVLERMGCLVRAGTEGKRIIWRFAKPWDKRDEGAARAAPRLKAV